MTSATQFVVIYAAGSKILRRTIVPGSDGEGALHQPGPGESRLLLPLTGANGAQPHDDAACRAAIAAATGVTPPSGRCVVVDGAGIVVAVCHADPALDLHPQGRLVAHDGAGIGERISLT